MQCQQVNLLPRPLDVASHHNVLIYSIYYYPEQTGIAPYTTALAEHLLTAGWEVTVVAGMPHYPQWQVHER